MTVFLRSEVPPQQEYADYREDLRRDFNWSCAYCTISESEAQGISFEIDHYLPRVDFPKLEFAYFNLFWACAHCNGYKSDHYPTDKMMSECLRLLRVDWDERSEHFRLVENRAEPVSAIGTHTEIMLRLNRQTLLRLRAIRRRLYEAEALIAEGVAALKGMSLDAVRADRRFWFVGIRADLEARAEAAAAKLKAMLATARSELLDADPKKAADLRERRAYVKELGPRGRRKKSRRR